MAGKIGRTIGRENISVKKSDYIFGIFHFLLYLCNANRMVMKRIVIIGPANPYRGGIAAFNERLAKQFMTEGNEVTVYTFTLQYPSFLFPGKTQYTSDPCPEGLKVHRRINSVNPFNWISVGDEIREMNADLVIFAYWMSFMAPCFGTIARRIKRNHHTRLIGLMHNMIPHEPKIIDRLFPGYFVSAMDGFAALSESVVRDIEKFDRHGKPKIASPHPIYDHYGELLPREEALAKLGLDSSLRYVLFFGFIRAYKGLDLLLEAMADERLRDVHLIVAGEFYEDSTKYTDIIKSHKLEDKVHLFTEYIPDTEVNRFFSACDIVAQPYKTATQSGVTQVAYHFEKPMLVTNVGGLSEIVPEGKVGYNVDPEAGAIARAISRFYESGADLHSGIVDEKKKYSWSLLTERLGKLM